MESKKAQLFDRLARFVSFTVHFTAAAAITVILIQIPLLFIQSHSGSTVSPAARLIPTGILLIPLLIYVSKRLKRRLFPDPATVERVPSGRWHSALKGAGMGLFCAYIFLILGCTLLNFGNIRLILSRNFLLTEAVFVLLGAFTGFFFPLKEEPRKRGWIITTLIALIPLGLLVSLVLAVLPVYINTSSRAVCRMAYGAEWTDKMLPEHATEIRSKGESMLFVHSFQWQCRVDEKDFLAFAEKNGYEFAENDPCHNVNPDTNDMKVDMSTLFPVPLPKSFYFYAYRYQNNGGIFMLYDRETQMLYGEYSSM